ncbi:MAG: hypothetical protein KBS60_01020 [Phascolarctobacterium sp.]|nr:hypothetical protein [Candidatus Phascolarctobacterium caballi]
MSFFGRKKFKGSAALFLTVATAAMVSAIAISLVKINAASSSKLLLSKRQMQAQQYALTEADLVKALRFREISHDTYNLGTSGTVQISGSDYYKNVVIGNEEYDEDSSIAKRVVTIEIFHKSDTTHPVFRLQVPRYEREKNSYVPVGTIIGWAGIGIPSDEDGTWIECNGKGCLLYGNLNRVLKDNQQADHGFTPDFRNGYLCAGNSSTVGGQWDQKLPDLYGELKLDYIYYSGYDEANYSSLYERSPLVFRQNPFSLVRDRSRGSLNRRMKSDKSIESVSANKIVFEPANIQYPDNILDALGILIGTRDKSIYSSRNSDFIGGTSTVQPKTTVVRYFMKAE